jgi:hypothetical protein
MCAGQEKCENPAFRTSNELFYFPERRIRFAGALISVLLSAVLLIGAIVCLLLIASYPMSFRVGMIVLFTSLFAVVVGILTNARRAVTSYMQMTLICKCHSSNADFMVFPNKSICLESPQLVSFSVSFTNRVFYH